MIEKVFWKEIGGCNWWRLPPFILGSRNSLTCAFCSALVHCSIRRSDCVTNHRLTSLVLSLDFGHIRKGVVSRNESPLRHSFNYRFFLLYHAVHSTRLSRSYDWVQLVFFIYSTHFVATFESSFFAALGYIFQKCLERALAILLTAFERYNAPVRLRLYISGLCFFKTWGLDSFDWKPETWFSTESAFLLAVSGVWSFVCWLEKLI